MEVVGAARAVGDLGRCVVEVDFLEGAGTRRRAPLGVCWDVAFERVAPVRSFGWSRGQQFFPGWWWSATTGDHVGYESWLERDHVMLLDFDRDVVGFASQPFWLHWPGVKRWRRHAPDFFVRRRDGGGVVIDVRADDRIEAADAEAFEVTARACAEVGWAFRRVGVVDGVLAANLRWLSRYRHPRYGTRAELVESLLQVFAEPTALFAGAARAGDRIGVLPVLFHLLWRQDLVVDLAAAPLAVSTIAVRRPLGAAR